MVFHRLLVSVWLSLGALVVAPAVAQDEALTLPSAEGRWSIEKAKGWYDEQPWLVGCNFIPSSAVNQLEMWQGDSFDPATIDRELGLAQSLGFNTVRVFLHDLLWKQDPAAFLQRTDQFLKMADARGIKTMFVFFDSCWYPLPKLGPQPDPIPFTHNSGWVQSPGIEVLQDPSAFPHLKQFVIGVIKHYANDRRVLAWDVWNEPDNFDGGQAGRPGLEPKNKPELVNALLPQVFAWAREASPTQPLTSGVWKDSHVTSSLDACKRIQLANSDVISFHCYGDAESMQLCIERLGHFGRPLLCTEYMARPNKSTFAPHLEIMKESKVAAYMWGFVNGKTQTIYPWDSWTKKVTEEPPLWFHDVLNRDGSPYSQEEVVYIRRVAGVRPLPTSGRRGPTTSPEKGADGQVTFRLDAPKAQKVELVGQWPNGTVDLSKSDTGPWTVTVDSIPAGVWEYSLRVDGVTMIDPSNPDIKPMRSPRTSILHLASEPPLLHDFRNVSHGSVHLHTYASKASGQTRKLTVYTPPGYENHSDRRYPLLVLQHGSGDNEQTWVTHGKAHWIADNLIAEGKAKPMVIAMLDGHIGSPTERGRGTELFEKDLMGQVLTFVESNYRVNATSDQRAIVGLSMGGGQSLSIGLRNTDKFSWIGGMSAAVPSATTIAAALDNPAETNQRLKLLWIGCGKGDFLLKMNQDFVESLTAKGIEHEWHLTEGNHSWPIWRGYLGELLPKLFVEKN